ncbi:hypothetical protein ACLQ18_38680 [Streptomyces sp. DT193]|uniref:hypothetical protein n=1 Tax=Streptomyces sp. DT193 TaxID=3393418 RepID=UPI003CFB95D7
MRSDRIPFEPGIPQRVFGKARDTDGQPLHEVVTCSVRPPGPVPAHLQIGHGSRRRELPCLNDDMTVRNRL